MSFTPGAAEQGRRGTLKKGRPKRTPQFGIWKNPPAISRDFPKPDGQGRPDWGSSPHQRRRPPERQQRRPGVHPEGRFQHRCPHPTRCGRWSLCHTRTTSLRPIEQLQALSFLRLLLAASIEKTEPEHERFRSSGLNSAVAGSRVSARSRVLSAAPGRSQVPDCSVTFRAAIKRRLDW